jgi:hypothetical protein
VIQIAENIGCVSACKRQYYFVASYYYLLGAVTQHTRVLLTLQKGGDIKNCLLDDDPTVICIVMSSHLCCWDWASELFQLFSVSSFVVKQTSPSLLKVEASAVLVEQTEGFVLK